MPFVFEKPTDEQQTAQGFATEAEVMPYVGLGLKTVDVWAIDREREAIMLSTRKIMGQRFWTMELHWKQHVILIDALADEKWRYPKEGETGSYRIDVFYNIDELMVPKVLQGQIEEVKNLIDEGLAVYSAGSSVSNGNGYTTFLPDMQIYYTDGNPKSKVKLANFQSSH